MSASPILPLGPRRGEALHTNTIQRARASLAWPYPYTNRGSLRRHPIHDGPFEFAQPEARAADPVESRNGRSSVSVGGRLTFTLEHLAFFVGSLPFLGLERRQQTEVVTNFQCTRAHEGDP